MVSWIVRKLAKITILGKIFEKLGPKFLPILFFTSLVFIVFYVPYEYENYLQFKEKFPENNVGLYLNLLRPIVIVGLLIGAIIYIFLNKKKHEREKAERIERERIEHEREKAEFLAKKQTAMKKLQELKTNPIGKAAGAVTTKEGIGAIGGASVGAALGGSLGVAGKFLGGMVFVNGGWVLAGIGGLVGYLGVKAFKKHKATKEEREKIIKEEQEKIKAYGEKINDDSSNKR